MHLSVHWGVGIATGYGMDDQRGRSSSPGWPRIFSSPILPDRIWGPPNPPIQRVTGALSPGVKRQGREDDHSPPTNTGVKKIWIYTSTPHTASWRNA
jgi:hypothetical protein